MAKREILWPLDTALACGIPVTVDGKEWKFSPLTYNDWAEIIRHQRAEAIKAYLEAVADKPTDYRQRAMDMSTILYGASAQHCLAGLREPSIRAMVLKQSLLKEHPEVTDEDVAMFLEQEHQTNLYTDVVELMSLGPITEQDMKESEKCGSDPTPEDQPDTQTTSAPSSSGSDGVSER
jgi:hypothetical protein